MRLLIALTLAACATAVPTIPTAIPDADVLPLTTGLCILMKQLMGMSSNSPGETPAELLAVYNKSYRNEVLKGLFEENTPKDRKDIEDSYVAVAAKLTPEEIAKFGAIARTAVYTQAHVDLCDAYIDRVGGFLP